MKTNDFYDQYKDPLWQRKRLEILERDEFYCHRCTDNKKELHVHHKYYDKNKKLWEYPEEAYITLCTDCHKKVHALIEQGTKILTDEMPMFLDELIDTLEVLKRFDPYQLMTIRAFLEKMHPLRSKDEI